MRRDRSIVGGIAWMTVVLVFGSGARAQESRNRFDAAQVVLSATDPQFQHLIDLDGDGRMDALGMRGGGGVSQLRLYRNQGAGDFVGVWNHTITWPGPGASPLSPLGVGDLDGDGRTDDFAITSQNQLRMFRGSGLSPVALPPLILPVAAHSLAITDLDQNGIDDLIIAGASFIAVALDPLGPAPSYHYLAITGIYTGRSILPLQLTNGSVALFLGAARVDFSLAGGLVMSSNGLPLVTDWQGASGDLDGDGDEDAVVHNRATGKWQFIIQGPGGQLVATSPTPGARVDELVDLDGDGDLDAIGCRGDNGSSGPLTRNDVAAFFVFSENDGAGGFQTPRSIRAHGAQRLAGVDDLDGDGDLDLIAGRSLYFGRGATLFARPVVALGSASAPRALFDSDDDGDLDGFGPSDLRFTNDGTGSMTAEATLILGPSPSGSLSGTRVLGDWNFDGKIDLLASSWIGGTPQGFVAFNLGGGTFAWNSGAVAAGISARAFEDVRLVADLDNDGDQDIVGVVPNAFFAEDSVVAMNNGLGTSFTASASLTFFRPSAVSDVDLNGLIDLIGNAGGGFGATTPGLHWMSHFPPGSFGAAAVIHPGVTQFGKPLVRDLDADGDEDIVAFVPGTGHVLLDNLGGGSFVQTLLLASGLGTGEMRYGLRDVTGDGVLDLLACPAPDAAECTAVLEGGPSGFVFNGVVHAFRPLELQDLDGDGDPDVLGADAAGLYRGLSFVGPNDVLRRQYGVGASGSGGLVPALGASGVFREGGISTVRIRNGRGGAIAYPVFSTVPAVLPDHPVAGITAYLDPFGASSLIWPPIVLGGASGVAGSGSADLPFFIPVGVAGIEFHHQVFVLDPGANFGISASQGLVLRYGL